MSQPRNQDRRRSCLGLVLFMLGMLLIAATITVAYFRLLASVEERREKASAAAFDPSDAKRSAAWLSDVGQELRNARGNELAKERGGKKLQAALDDLAGRRLRWTVKVLSVAKDGENAAIAVAPLTPRSEGRGVVVYLTSPLENIPEWQAHFLPTSYRLVVPQQEWMAELKPGDNVVVSGTIDSGRHYDDFFAIPVVLTLKTVKLDPP